MELLMLAVTLAGCALVLTAAAVADVHTGYTLAMLGASCYAVGYILARRGA